MPNLGYAAPDTPENRRKQFREQQRQHSKNDDTGDKVGTAEKTTPVREFFVNPEPDKRCGRDREKQRCEEADQP